MRLWRAKMTTCFSWLVISVSSPKLFGVLLTLTRCCGATVKPHTYNSAVSDPETRPNTRSQNEVPGLRIVIRADQAVTFLDLFAETSRSNLHLIKLRTREFQEHTSNYTTVNSSPSIQLILRVAYVIWLHSILWRTSLKERANYSHKREKKATVAYEPRTLNKPKRT